MNHARTLHYIDAIARNGSIRRAAEALAITPSALNRRLLALEDELGAPLFERQARGVRMSAAGELFVHHARRQIADMARVRASIEDMKGARRGHVTIAIDASLSPGGLAALIAAHRLEHPGVTFAVLPCDRLSASVLLEDYRADLAVVAEPDGRFATLAAAPLVLDVLMAPGHVLAGRARVRIQDMLAHPLALPPPGQAGHDLLEVAAARRGLTVSPVVTGEAGVLRPLLSAGGALGLRLRIAPAEREAGAAGEDLRAVPLSAEDMPPAVLRLTQQRGRALPVPAARFAEAIGRRMAEVSGEA